MQLKPVILRRRVYNDNNKLKGKNNNGMRLLFNGPNFTLDMIVIFLHRNV